MADVLGISNWIVKIEDDPRHPGVCKDLGDGAGLTRMGITQRWHANDVPAEFFTTMQNDLAYRTARLFYAVKYCGPLRVSAINSDQVAAPLVSFAVNDTISVAVKTLQRVLGLKVDGSLGPITLAEINAKDPVAVTQQFNAEWSDFYTRDAQLNASKQQFLNGWHARVMRVYPN